MLSLADPTNNKAGAKCEYQQYEHREHHHNHAHKVLQHFRILQSRVVVDEDRGTTHFNSNAFANTTRVFGDSSRARVSQLTISRDKLLSAYPTNVNEHVNHPRISHSTRARRMQLRLYVLL